MTKKFDFILLYGDINKIRELSLICKENGGSYLKIAPYYVINEPNLMLTVGPENSVKNSLGTVKRTRSNSHFCWKIKQRVS